MFQGHTYSKIIPETRFETGVKITSKKITVRPTLRPWVLRVGRVGVPETLGFSPLTRKGRHLEDTVRFPAATVQSRV